MKKPFIFASINTDTRIILGIANVFTKVQFQLHEY
jgi:hypothetical protein